MTGHLNPLQRAIIPGMILTFAGIPLYFGTSRLQHTHALYINNERIPGTVIVSSHLGSSRHRTAQPKYLVSYDQNGDGASEIGTIYGSTLSFVNTFREGDAVVVIQEKNNPSNAALDEGGMTWVFPLLESAILLFLSSCFLMVLYAGIKSGKLWK